MFANLLTCVHMLLIIWLILSNLMRYVYNPPQNNVSLLQNEKDALVKTIKKDQQSFTPRPLMLMFVKVINAITTKEAWIILHSSF